MRQDRGWESGVGGAGPVPSPPMSVLQRRRESSPFDSSPDGTVPTVPSTSGTCYTSLTDVTTPGPTPSPTPVPSTSGPEVSGCGRWTENGCQRFATTHTPRVRLGSTVGGTCPSPLTPIHRTGPGWGRDDRRQVSWRDSEWTVNEEGKVDGGTDPPTCRPQGCHRVLSCRSPIAVCPTLSHSIPPTLSPGHRTRVPMAIVSHGLTETIRP